MGVLRSKLGWTLVVVYVVAFITVYAHVQSHRGTFLYDIGLDLLALPYILVVGRLLLPQNFVANAQRRFRGGRLHWTRLWSMVVLGHFVRRTELSRRPDEDIALHSFA